LTAVAVEEISVREPFEAVLMDMYREHIARVPVEIDWFDAHTHTGFNDPDGFKASAEQIIAGLDLAGQRRALVFSSQEPDGYREANDRVLAEAAASGGRLIALARLDPHHEDALAEAERCLDGGAAGFKLHPRAERFEMHEPAVDRVVALAAERRLPIMIHAGRGIPALGRDTVDLCRRHPGARLILAHAGISDLAWIWREAPVLPNLFFDTAWWNIADLMALFSLVPPGHILYASDMPYGHAVFNAIALLRCGEAVGLASETIAEIAGRQLSRVVAGDEPADLGPAPGPPTQAPPPNAPRVVAHLTGAISRVMGGGGDPTEPLALARLACDVPPDDPERPLLERVEAMIAAAEEACPDLPLSLRGVVGPAVCGALVAGTPAVPV
jgi:predicted TIM-barrel fold metal-dependent hydrolase